MFYNIALLPKKKYRITLLSYFLWNVTHRVTLRYFPNLGRACLLVFNATKSSVF